MLSVCVNSLTLSLPCYRQHIYYHLDLYCYVYILSSYGGKNLTEPEGFCFTWAGARATYGVTRGKVFTNVTITNFLFQILSLYFNNIFPLLLKILLMNLISFSHIKISNQSFEDDATPLKAVSILNNAIWCLCP